MPSFPADTAILLVRHAQSVDNAQGLISGLHDAPLTDLGVVSARSASSSLNSTPVVRVITSPLLRARQTATLLAARVDLLDARLAERAAGEWECRMRSELEAAFPGSLTDDALRPSSFEMEDVVAARMNNALLDARDAQGLVLVVGHSGAIRCWARHYRDATDVRVPNLGALALDFELNILGTVELAAR